MGFWSRGERRKGRERERWERRERGRRRRLDVLDGQKGDQLPGRTRGQIALPLVPLTVSFCWKTSPGKKVRFTVV